jgi:hypothetical protein
MADYSNSPAALKSAAAKVRADRAGGTDSPAALKAAIAKGVAAQLAAKANGGKDTHNGGSNVTSSRPPAAAAPRPPATAATPTAQSPVASIVQPFLTPTQQAALDKIDSNYGFTFSADQRKIADATTTTNTGLFNSQVTHDTATSNANQAMAARGLFQSSIRDSELNDLDTAMTARNNLLNTNLNRLALDTNAAMGHLTSNWVDDHNMYNAMAVTNAQAQVPVLPPPVVTPPAPKPPANPAPPTTQPPNPNAAWGAGSTANGNKDTHQGGTNLSGPSVGDMGGDKASASTGGK